jgi:hypothetical protein
LEELPDVNLANNTARVSIFAEAETTTDYTLDASASTNTANEGGEVTFSFSLSADGVTESGRLTITASDAWADPKPGASFVVVDGDTMSVAVGDSVKVEDDPEGFPEGTTRITYVYPAGFSGGVRYDGSLTLKAGQNNTSADKAQARASVRFEAFVPGNDDPNPADDVVEVFVDIEDTGTAVAPDPGEEIPQVFRLHANYPNPFNPETTIRFDVKERARVRLQVFNLLGQAVETLVDEVLAPGTYQAVFDARGLPTGSYFYRLEAGGFSETKPMVLLK